MSFSMVYMPNPYNLLKMLGVGGQSVDTWLDHHSPNRILSTLFLPETSRLSSLLKYLLIHRCHSGATQIEDVLFRHIARFVGFFFSPD